MNISPTTGSSLRDFLHILFKRKAWIVSIFLGTVLLVGIGTFLKDPTYKASSQILVKVGRENLYVPTAPAGGNSTPVINLNHEEQINSEIEILKGRSLAETVIQSIGPEKLYEDLEENPEGGYSPAQKAVLRFKNNLEVYGIRKSDIIQVDFRHHNPTIAAMAVNRLVEAFLDRHVEVHKNPKSYAFFQNQAELLQTNLKKAQRELESFKKFQDVSSLDEERRLLLQHEADLRTELNRTQSKEAETRKRLHQLRLQLADTPATILQGEEVEHNPQVIGNLQERLVELELKEKALLIKYTEQNGLVQNVREEVAIVRNKLAEQEERRYGKSRTGLNVMHQQLQQMSFENEAELEALQAKRKTETAHLEEYQEQLAKLNRIEVELNQLEQKVDVDRQNYRLYLTKYEESRISSAMDTEKIANVSLIESAGPPLRPVSPKVLLNLLLALFIGAFGGLGLAFVMEYLDDSLEKTEEVEDLLQVPVLASIPDFSR